MNSRINTNIQDTTSQQQPAIQLQRNDLSFQTNSFVVDSARLSAAKTIAPVKKTIPYVPTNDTICHPVYNPLNNSFIIQSDSSILTKLKLNPVEPLTEEASNPVAPKVVRIQHSITVPEKQISRKETRQNTGSGFESTDWMLGIIVFSLILFGWIRVVFGRFVSMVIQASYNYFTARRMFDEANVVRNRVFVFFNLLFFINIGLFSSQAIDFFNLNPTNIKGITLFGICFGAFFILYTLKSFFLLVLDYIFLTPGGLGSYNFTVFLYNKLYGLLLIPIIAILPFVNVDLAQWLIVIGVGLFVLFYFFRILRGIQIGYKNRLSIFYLFLYLCALEILPLLVFYKVVISYN